MLLRLQVFKGAGGFSRNLPAERIIVTAFKMGELTFLVKWTGSEETDYVPAKQANREIPQVNSAYPSDVCTCPFQVVIKFYEDLLRQYVEDNGGD